MNRIKQIKLIILLCILLLLTGCSFPDSTYICYDIREPDTIVSVTVTSMDGEKDVAYSRCQERLSKVVMEKIK